MIPLTQLMFFYHLLSNRYQRKVLLFSDIILKYGNLHEFEYHIHRYHVKVLRIVLNLVYVLLSKQACLLTFLPATS